MWKDCIGPFCVAQQEYLRLDNLYGREVYLVHSSADCVRSAVPAPASSEASESFQSWQKAWGAGVPHGKRSKGREGGGTSLFLSNQLWYELIEQELTHHQGEGAKRFTRDPPVPMTPTLPIRSHLQHWESHFNIRFAGNKHPNYIRCPPYAPSGLTGNTDGGYWSPASIGQ